MDVFYSFQIQLEPLDCIILIFLVCGRLYLENENKFNVNILFQSKFNIEKNVNLTFKETSLI
jgi:hypothetical protein